MAWILQSLGYELRAAGDRVGLGGTPNARLHEHNNHEEKEIIELQSQTSKHAGENHKLVEMRFREYLC